MLIFQQPLARCFAWAVRSAQAARWAPLGKGSVVGSFRCPALGSGGLPVCARFNCRVRRAVVVGPAHAMSCLTGARPINPDASPRLSVSVDFIFALSRGWERDFRPNLSSFLSCSASLFK